MACTEEIAYRKGWLRSDDVLAQAKVLGKTQYGQYLKMLVEEK